MKDWKTTLAGAMPILAIGAARAYGYQMSPEEAAAVTAIAIMVLGFFSSDKS